jgi:uncharacterized protein (TIGR00369 family)
MAGPGGFVPQNPDFEAAVRESFGRQTLMKTLGVELAHVEPGQVHLRLAYSPGLCQQNGYLHAGAIASAADSANGYAAYTLAPADTDVLAVEFKINLLAPARGPEFLACRWTDTDRHDALHNRRPAPDAAAVQLTLSTSTFTVASAGLNTTRTVRVAAALRGS